MNDSCREQLERELMATEDMLEDIRERVRICIYEQPSSPMERRRPVPWLRLGMACSVAAAISLAIALSPFERDPDEAGISPAPAAASAALRQAARSAGKQPWHPLRAGEFHHTMVTTFIPEVPPTTLDSKDDIRMIATLGAPSSQEAWIDRDGRGMTIDAMGGNGDPDLYPVVQADGYGSQPTYGRDYPDIQPIEVHDSLHYADQVRTGRTLDADRIEDSIWYRTPTGYLRKVHKVLGRGTVSGGSYPDFMQSRAWGSPYEAIDAVNSAPPRERSRAIIQLLDGFPRGFQAPPLGRVGEFGITSEEARTETRIMRAMKLLGTAPLAPPVRRAIFNWLADQPGARLDADQVDELGRHGARVSFEREYSKTVDATTMSYDEVLAEARSRFGPRMVPPAKHQESYDVSAGTEYRRWYVSIVFDIEAGELLEQVAYERTQGLPRPRIQEGYRGRRMASKGSPKLTSYWEVAIHANRQSMVTGELYSARERTKSLTNARTAACETTPAICP